MQVSRVDDYAADLRWDFRWGDYRHLTEATGRHRGLEFKAKLPSALADRIGGPSANNFPSGSRFYVDTILGDPSNEKNFGIGSADSNFFGTGTYYWGSMRVLRPNYIGANSYPVQVSVAAMTREDHNLSGCSYQVALCTFPDYSQTVIRGRNLYVGSSGFLKHWNQNWLYNQSFEEGYPGFPGYALQPGNNYAVYCNGGGYRSNCFLEFNRGSNSIASVYQDVTPPHSIQATDNYTAEAMVRCPSGQPSCSIRLAYWGLGGQYQEVKYSQLGLAADGRWYMCRVDVGHNGTSFATGHDKLRWELYSLNNSNLNVDYTTIAMPVQTTSDTKSDRAPLPSNGALCEYADWYDQ